MAARVSSTPWGGGAVELASLCRVGIMLLGGILHRIPSVPEILGARHWGFRQDLQILPSRAALPRRRGWCAEGRQIASVKASGARHPCSRASRHVCVVCLSCQRQWIASKLRLMVEPASYNSAGVLKRYKVKRNRELDTLCLGGPFVEEGISVKGTGQTAMGFLERSGKQCVPVDGRPAAGRLCG
jgi:hypothetical protein